MAAQDQESRLGSDRDLELLLQQSLPVKAAVPLVLHHASGPPSCLPKPLALVDLEQLADNVLRCLERLMEESDQTKAWPNNTRRTELILRIAWYSFPWDS